MRRADRLFQIIQILRRSRTPATADAIAAELETSKRTIYRDIAALIGQHLPAFEAAQLGVYLHGLAGDLARDQIGEVSLIATDLLDFLPPAIRQAIPG